VAIRFGVSSTVKNRLPRYSNFWDGTAVFNPFTATGSYDALASYTVPSGGVASITFAGLPTGGQYAHLQIRGISRTNISATEDYMLLRFNNDTSASYAYHALEGNGSSAAAAAQSSVSTGYLQRSSGNSTSAFGTTICDVLDYASSTKNKTYRTLAGVENNGSGIVMLVSSLWAKTEPINSISILPGGGSSFQQYSQFALYGIRG
jgi:hypothetical protein